MIMGPQLCAGRDRRQPDYCDVLLNGMSNFNLDRFIAAQAPVIGQVRRELESGAKRTHWMWFIFPQLRGLGHSLTAQHYGLPSRAKPKPSSPILCSAPA